MSGRMNLQEELNCPICLDRFRSPVTTACGHSFCTDCISKHWDNEATSYSCPDCRRTFSNRPWLAKSIRLSQISEAWQGAKATPRAGPGTRCHVHGRELEFYCRKERVAICSLCANRDHKIHETVTLEEEAELTREPIVQRQNLVELNLRGTLDEITAWKERADSLQVCLQRIGAEVEEEFRELMSAVDKARGEVGGLLQRAERDLVHQSRAAVTQLEQHEAQLRQEQLHLQTLLGQQDHLQLLEESQTLKMTPDCPVCLASQSEVPAHLTNLSLATTVLSDQLREQLEDFTQLNVPVSATAAQEERRTEAPEKPSSPQTIPTADTTALPAAPLAAEKQTLSSPRPFQDYHTQPPTRHELHSAGTATFSMPRHLEDSHKEPGTREELLQSAGTATFSMPRHLEDCHKEPGTREDLLQYLTVVTFDPNTASNQLKLSEDGRSAVSSFFEPQQYSDHLNRFNRLPQVLGVQGFSSGRHYWEMSITGSPVLIGLAYSNMSRRGRGTSCFLGRNDTSWCLQLAEGTGTAWHDNQSDDLGPVPCQRIGLYLDYTGQALSFYGITDRVNLLHRFQAHFTQPLLPAFQINRDASVQIGVRIRN